MWIVTYCVSLDRTLFSWFGSLGFQALPHCSNNLTFENLFFPCPPEGQFGAHPGWQYSDYEAFPEGVLGQTGSIRIALGQAVGIRMRESEFIVEKV